ncbi:MAG: sulfotransferase [Gemmatimonadota bacterium]
MAASGIDDPVIAVPARGRIRGRIAWRAGGEGRPGPAGRRWGDQTPAYALHMPAVLRLFPDAQFLHVLRDARDVALSWRRLEEHRGHSLWHIGNTWRWYVATARRDSRQLAPGAYLELRYEELVRDTEGQLRRACDFLGESFEAGMLQFHREAERHIPRRMAETHHRKLTGPVQARNAGRWREAMPLRDRLAVEIATRPTLAALGYPVSPLSLPGVPLGWLRSLKARSRIRKSGRDAGSPPAGR